MAANRYRIIATQTSSSGHVYGLYSLLCYGGSEPLIHHVDCTSVTAPADGVARNYNTDIFYPLEDGYNQTFIRRLCRPIRRRPKLITLPSQVPVGKASTGHHVSPSIGQTVRPMSLFVTAITSGRLRRRTSMVASAAMAERPSPIRVLSWHAAISPLFIFNPDLTLACPFCLH